MNAICLPSHHDSLKALREDPEFRTVLAIPETEARFFIELRLDRYNDLYTKGTESLAETLRFFGPQNCIVTYRSPAEGGARPQVSDLERLVWLRRAALENAAYIDLEWHTLKAMKIELGENFKNGENQTKCILSFHDFEGMPTYDRLREIRRSCEAAGADVVKQAVKPQNVLDAEPLLKLLTDHSGQFSKPYLGLAMGESGLWSRVLAPVFPGKAPFTFARGEHALGTAPGQPDWRTLLELYRYPQLQPDWPVFGVIGNPISHSLSPQMHNAALKAAGCKGVYLPFLVDAEADRFVELFGRYLNLQGLSVTIPYKETVQRACYRLDPLAERIGAVNTLVRAADGWFGFNTDSSAAAASLELAMGGPGALQDRTVLILGAGGAAKAVAFGVKALGASALICNRSAERGENLAQAVSGRFVSMQDLASPNVRFDAVINTTPIGMHPNVEETPLQESLLPKDGVIFDTVYNPFRTTLLQQAEARGLKTLEGLSMFIGQGAAQFERFTQCKAPLEVMEAVVRAALLKRR